MYILMYLRTEFAELSTFRRKEYQMLQNLDCNGQGRKAVSDLGHETISLDRNNRYVYQGPRLAVDTARLFFCLLVCWRVFV